jgi:hypothetical protein
VNKKQRTVLIIGAGVLLYVLFASPKISIVKGTYVTPSPDKKSIAKIIVDVSIAITKTVAFLGAILLIPIALKDKKGTRIQSTMDRNPIAGGCQERPVKVDVIAKIIRFLKDFFLRF